MDEKESQKAIGARIKKTREERGLNQGDLAELCGQGRSTISNWELGSSSPRAADIVGLARALKVSADWLLSGEDTRTMLKNQAFTISHADGSAFAGQGLRAFFEYRQLGIAEATQGRYGAHVIRAVPGMDSPGGWHTHDLDFQMVYVTRGWVVFEYEGEGEHVLRAGSCVLQPPGIRHRELRHSDDLELIEITSPAEFATHAEGDA